jgi:hypothetical protein
MEDWIARAINPAKNHTQKDAAVAKDALTCNRWIASSALQKAIRRGDVALAQRAAFALHREDCSAIWRRLTAIAFEDVGPAGLDVILETVAVATLPKWRAVIGEEAVLRSIVATLATAPKDRSADYLMWIAAEHPNLVEMREICGRSSISECLSMVLDHSRSLPDRAVAAWFSSGINYPYQHRVGAGDLAGLGDAYCRLGVPPIWWGPQYSPSNAPGSRTPSLSPLFGLRFSAADSARSLISASHLPLSSMAFHFTRSTSIRA